MYHVYRIPYIPDDGHAAGLCNLIPGLPKKKTSRYFRQQQQCLLPFHGFFACRDSRVISYHVWLKSFLLTSASWWVWRKTRLDGFSQSDFLAVNWIWWIWKDSNSRNHLLQQHVHLPCSKKSPNIHTYNSNIIHHCWDLFYPSRLKN